MLDLELKHIKDLLYNHIEYELFEASLSILIDEKNISHLEVKDL